MEQVEGRLSMDTFKVKKYLIVSFLILNILLIASIISDKRSLTNDFDGKSVQNLYQMLNNQNILCQIPLDYKTYKADILKGEYITPSKENYPYIYENFSDISQIDGKWLQLSLEHDISPFTKDEVLKYTSSFISNYLPHHSYALKEYYVSETSVSVTYERTEEDYFIEDGYVQFIISIQGRTDISILDIHLEKQDIPQVDIISTAKAVASIFSSLEGKNILDIKRGYMTSTQDSDIPSTLSTTLMPIYRIATDDDSYLYVNALED